MAETTKEQAKNSEIRKKNTDQTLQTEKRITSEKKKQKDVIEENFNTEKSFADLLEENDITLNKNGVPSGPIYSIDQAFEDPQVKHLEMAKKVKGHARGDIDLVGQPVRLSRTPSGMSLPPPDYGEHTNEILDELGLSDAEIKELREANII